MSGGPVKKTPFLKKLRPLTSLFFKFYKQLICTGWRVCFNVPRPEAFADTATLRTILDLQVMFFAAKKLYFIYLKSRPSHDPRSPLHIRRSRQTSQGPPTLPGSPPRPSSLQQGRAKDRQDRPHRLHFRCRCLFNQVVCQDKGFPYVQWLANIAHLYADFDEGQLGHRHRRQCAPMFWGEALPT